jgi:hypothetical protein
MYLIFENKEKAQKRNNEIALLQGSGDINDITKYWFDCIEDAGSSQVALVITDESLITEIEKSKLVDNINHFEKLTWSMD